MSAGVTFEVLGVPAGAPESLVGLWHPAPRAVLDQGEVMFSTASDGGEAEELPVWRITVPEDPAAAREAIARSAEQITASQRLIAALRARLPRVGPSGGPPSDAHFAQAVETLQQDLTLPGVTPPSLLRDLGSGAREQFDAVLELVHRTLSGITVVETIQAEALLARTSVGWLGDARTVLRHDVVGHQAALHSRSLEVALRSRATFLQTFSFASRFALALGVGGPAALLPLTWRYANRLLAAAAPLFSHSR
ncbi:MAG: hypothetical protein RLZZ387_5423 [Chloroflexota bacterium]